MLKYLILGLLEGRSRHGYELRQAITERFQGTWSINAGQIYTTLDRLERDGLIDREIVRTDLAPDRRVCSITEGGRAELKRWLVDPVDPPVRLKDELFAKALVHRTTGEGRTGEFIARQRDACLQALASLTRARRDRTLEPTTRLLLDGAVLRLEADLKWLDLWEASDRKEAGG